jgi:hypothetical protein
MMTIRKGKLDELMYSAFLSKKNCTIVEKMDQPEKERNSLHGLGYGLKDSLETL